MLNNLKKLNIGWRLLFSATVGVAFASVITFPIIVAMFQVVDFENDVWFHDFNLLKSMIGNLFLLPLLMPLSLIIAGPLIGVALVVALAFRASIEKRPAVWCLIAPVAVWLFTCLVFTLMRDNEYARSHTIFEVFATVISGIDNLLFLLGPIPSAAIFYYLTISRRSGPSAGLATDRA